MKVSFLCHSNILMITFMSIDQFQILTVLFPYKNEVHIMCTLSTHDLYISLHRYILGVL